MIPEGLSADLRFADWKVPPLFATIQELGGVSEEEMFKTFNMGVGFVLIVPEQSAAEAIARLRDSGETVMRLGEVSAAPAGSAVKVTLGGSS